MIETKLPHEAPITDSPHDKENVLATEWDGESQQTDNNMITVDGVTEKRVLAKLDIFITPVLFIVYLSCFIDRANIGKRGHECCLS